MKLDENKKEAQPSMIESLQIILFDFRYELVSLMLIRQYPLQFHLMMDVDG